MNARPIRRPVTIRIPQRHLRAFAFYAKHYEIPVARLLQSEVHGQLVALSENVFGNLAWFDSMAGMESTDEITLEFCPDFMALLSRVSAVLRRPLAEFIPALVNASALVLSDYIKNALNGAGMDCPNMQYFADAAIQFERMARQNKSPGWGGSADAWIELDLRRGESKTEAIA